MKGMLDGKPDNHVCTLGIWGNLRIMSIVRLWNCEAPKPRTFRVGNGGFDDADLGGRAGETSIESGVCGPDDELSEDDDDDDDAGLMGCKSGTS
jgi:hypothetical protein